LEFGRIDDLITNIKRFGLENQNKDTDEAGRKEDCSAMILMEIPFDFVS
jgi:hypothetical protein